MGSFSPDQVPCSCVGVRVYVREMRMVLTRFVLFQEGWPSLTSLLLRSPALGGVRCFDAAFPPFLRPLHPSLPRPARILKVVRFNAVRIKGRQSAGWINPSRRCL